MLLVIHVQSMRLMPNHALQRTGGAFLVRLLMVFSFRSRPSRRSLSLVR